MSVLVEPNQVSGPAGKVGFIAPGKVVSNNAYEFYGIAPREVMARYLPVGLEELSRADVTRAYRPLAEIVNLLGGRENDLDLLVQGGVPVPLVLGKEAHDELLSRMSSVANGVPCSSVIELVVDALTALGAERVALANKWGDELNEVLGRDFLAPAGIHVEGVQHEAMALRDIFALSASAGAELAYHLGRRALAAYPAADALYIGGGAWLTSSVVERLEDEFSRPVVSNAHATAWGACRRIGMWRPLDGRGTLLAMP